MKCILLAAGATKGGSYGFPPDSKPKCLFVYKNQVILEHTVGVLKRQGINDTRIVTGYKKEMIEQFNDEHEMGLEIVHTSGETCFDTILAALKDIDDDVLLIFGDVWLNEQSLRTILESKDRLILVLGGHGIQIYKFGRECLADLRKIENKNRNTWWFLYDFFMTKKGVDGFQCENNVYSGPKIRVFPHCLSLKKIRDIDYYWQTAEGIAAGVTRRNPFTENYHEDWDNHRARFRGN